MQFSTPTLFFEEMERNYANQIPELTGLLTDPWNLRINAVPSVLKKRPRRPAAGGDTAAAGVLRR